jgi:hypothetical protein
VVRMLIDRDGEPFGISRVVALDGPDAAGRVVAGAVDPVLFDIGTVFGQGIPGRKGAGRPYP